MAKLGSALGRFLPILAAAVVSIIPGIGTLTAGLIVGGSAILGGVLGRLSSVRPDIVADRGDGLLINNNSTQAVVRVIYGERMVGSNDVYINTSSEAISGTNDLLWIVSCLGEGEIEGIAKDSEEHELLFINDKQFYLYDQPLPEWTLYYGNGNQTVDPALNLTFPEYTDNLRYTAYIVFKFKFNSELYNGVPSRRVVIKGRKLFDMRTSITAWSNNPVLILYDYLSNERYGLGLSLDSLDDSSWNVAADYCDSEGWTLDYVIDSQDQARDIIDTILASFRGVLIWSQEKFVVKFADLRYESSVFDLMDKHIAQTDSGYAAVSMSQPTKHNRPDGLLVKFVDKRNDWVYDDINIGDAQGQIQQITFEGCTDRKNAQLMGKYLLERTRLDRSVSILARADCIGLEVYSLITVTCKELALENFLMRIIGSVVTSQWLVQLTLIPEDISLYDTVYQPDTSTIYKIALPNPLEAPPSIRNASVLEEVYDYRERSFIRLTISYLVPVDCPWYSHVNVYLSFTNNGTDWKFLFTAGNSFVLDPVEEGVWYYLLLRTVSYFGVEQDVSAGFPIAHYVLGISTTYPPDPNPLHINVSDAAVTLSSEIVRSLTNPSQQHPDVATYEFRVGHDWNTAVFLTNGAKPFITYGTVKPANHTFWINTIGTNGIYGENPAYEDLILPEPPEHYVVVAKIPIDYVNGVHSNTEVLSDGWLQCSHTGGILFGEYIAPIVEMPVGSTYLIYLSYNSTFYGLGDTWDDLVPVLSVDETSWATLGVTRTWLDILGITPGIKSPIEIVVNYGANETVLDREVERMEILSTITTINNARVFQITIKLEDNNAGTHFRVGPMELVVCTETL